jgi:hypothetical protein
MLFHGFGGPGTAELAFLNRHAFYDGGRDSYFSKGNRDHFLF